MKYKFYYLIETEKPPIECYTVHEKGLIRESCHSHTHDQQDYQTHYTHQELQDSQSQMQYQVRMHAVSRRFFFNSLFLN